jgi:hypothetical protein
LYCRVTWTKEKDATYAETERIENDPNRQYRIASWEILPSRKILGLFFFEHFCVCSKISVGFVPLLAMINWVTPLALKGEDIS